MIKISKSLPVLLWLGACGMVFGCAPKGENKGSAEPAAADTTAMMVDSARMDSGICYSSVLLTTPKGAGEALTHSVREWISEELGGSYSGDYADVKGMATHYMKEGLKPLLEESAEFRLDGVQLYSKVAVEKLAEGKSYLTMSCFFDEFAGGAHGISILRGATFRKSDGRRIGWDVFKTSSDAFQKLMSDSLKVYFNVKTDKELAEVLMIPNSEGPVPLPLCGPLFTKEGVLFQYQSYEICCYADGQPNFVILYKVLMPFMMETAKRLLQ
ncbi:RsiV family protein [Alloprevotella rava]|uniref:DUF3298 domain-containing protein n=1 Tax=Alloprevotella rava TaxID=671218 RepID=A0A7W5XX03_9BACT|nr:RsiV family protein [Alloprevotella rava]MBB3701783.1 hypothetical protein [Alloprevotella rava]